MDGMDEKEVEVRREQIWMGWMKKRWEVRREQIWRDA